MTRYDELKNRYPRLRNTMFYLVVISLGIVTICIITWITSYYKSSYQVPNDKSQFIDSEIEEEKKIDIDIDIDYLLNYTETKLTETNTLYQVASKLALGKELKDIRYSEQINRYGAELDYDISNYHSLLEDFTISHKLLINSVILMALYDNLNVIKFNVTQDSNTVQKLFYRQNLEQYLKSNLPLNTKPLNGVEMNLISVKNNNMHNNIAYLIDADNAMEYISNTGHYTSELGKDVDYFYEANFSLYTGPDTEIPYMDEDLGNNLLEKYGSKLFIEGLKHKNEYVKYYSAYRLIEFYGHENLEEIVLELTICEQKCSDIRVKKACEYVRGIFTNISNNKNRLVTRYAENEYRGGKNIYLIDDDNISVWGEFDTPTNVIGELLPKYGLGTESKILINGENQEGKFIYIVPVEIQGKYMFSNKEASSGDKSYSDIIKLLQEKISTNTEYGDLDNVNITFNWYDKSCLLITLEEYNEQVIYNFTEDRLVIYTDNKSEMEVEQFLCELANEFDLYGQQIVDKNDINSKEEKMLVNTSKKSEQIFLEEIKDSFQTSDIDTINVYTNDNLNSGELEELKRSYEISENKLSDRNQVENRATMYYNNNFIITYKGNNNGLRDVIESILY